jgi:large subunit ribosomal protein L25
MRKHEAALSVWRNSMSSMKQLAAKRRERVGKGAARAVRRELRVPAVIYGSGQAPVAISLDYKETNTLIYAGHFLTTVFEINVEGEKIRAIPRDYQLDVVKDTPLHIDFQRLISGSKIRVKIPVHFINQDIAPGIKKGGALNIIEHSVEMMVPADAIPDALTVDLDGIEMGQSVHISSVKLPDGCKPTTSGDFTLASIGAPSGYKEAVEADAAAAAAAVAAPAAKK